MHKLKVEYIYAWPLVGHRSNTMAHNTLTPSFEDNTHMDLVSKMY